MTREDDQRHRGPEEGSPAPEEAPEPEAALGPGDHDDLDGPDHAELGDGAREPSEGAQEDDFGRVEPGPTEVVSFPTRREGLPEEDDEDAPDLGPARAVRLLGLVLAALALAFLGVFLLWQVFKGQG